MDPEPTIRTVTRFAWCPVHISGTPILRAANWMHLVWYESVECLESSYGEGGTADWVQYEARPLPEATDVTHA